MELRPGYKQTEMGVIPEEWEVKSLADCISAHPDYGINAPAVSRSDALPVYIRITDITEDGRFSPEKLVSVDSVKSGNYYLSDGDIVFARTGASVGKSYRYDEKDGQLVFAGFLIRVRPNPRKLLCAFAAAYVTTGSYWNWVRLMSTRSGQPGINGNEYAQLPIPVPPPHEQRAIAETLGDVDALISALARFIVKKRELKQAVLQQLLTGQTRLPGFGRRRGSKHTDVGKVPSDWNCLQIPELTTRHSSSIKIGPFGSQLKKEVLSKTGYKVYGQENVFERDMASGDRYISEEYFRQLKSCEIHPGDFVISMMGTVGKCMIVPSGIQEGIMDSHLLRLRLDPSKIDQHLLFQLFDSRIVFDQVKQLSVGGIMEGLSSKIIRQISLPLPELREQTAIATVLTDMDAEIAALEARLAKTRALKQGMMQELLTGKTRLV